MSKTKNEKTIAIKTTAKDKDVHPPGSSKNKHFKDAAERAIKKHKEAIKELEKR